jgi:putative transposase
MMRVTTKTDSRQPATELAHLFDNWLDPIETGVRERVREFIEELIRSELDAVLARPRYGRRAKSAATADGAADVVGHRHGSRMRSLTGTFGKTEIAVPRARLEAPAGKTAEWKSAALRAYQRRTLAADALIAGSTASFRAEHTREVLASCIITKAQLGERDVNRLQNYAVAHVKQVLEVAPWKASTENAQERRASRP